jgi:hypothetical protein
VKPVGKLDAGNRHVQFDERGGETDRECGTAPFLDSTSSLKMGCCVDSVSRIKHLRHVRRDCPDNAQNRLFPSDYTSDAYSALISDSNPGYRRATRMEV